MSEVSAHWLESTDVVKRHESDTTPSLQGHVLLVVGLALFCDYLLLTVCIPILPNLLGNSFSPLMISLVFAAKPTLQFFFNPIMGTLVDRHGPKYPLLVGVFVLAISTLFFAYGVSLHNMNHAYIVLIVARMVQGIASASTMSAGMTLIAMTHPESIRGAAMGMAMIGVAAGALSGPPVGGILSYYTNYWTPFVITGGVLLLDFIAQLSILHDTLTCIPCAPIRYIEDEEKQEFVRKSSSSGLCSGADGGEGDGAVDLRSMLQLVRDPQVGTVFAVCILGNACVGMIEPLVPLYLRDQFGTNILNQGLIFACATLSYLVFTPIAGHISDTHPKWMCLGLGMLSCALGLLLLMGTASLDAIPLVCVCLVCIGTGMSFIDTPTLPLLSELVERRKLGSLGMVYALNDMAISLGFTLGPVLGAAIQTSLSRSMSDMAAFRYTSLSAGCFVLLVLPWAVSILRRDAGELPFKRDHDPNAPRFSIAEFRSRSSTSSNASNASRKSEMALNDTGTTMKQSLLNNNIK
jgi:MFS transporter, DHA1 family, solute carrier family 18 (vesicular amine transporter), member 1/2